MRMGRSESVWVLIVILVVATLNRIYALGFEGLWCDEAYSALTVRMPFGEMISELLRMDDAPPLFYILEKCTTILIGDSEAGLRVLSAMAGIAAVATVLWVAHSRRSASDRWAAAFLAVAATGIFHARQARSYSLLVLFGTGLVLSARAMLFERRRAGPFLAICTTMLCLTHHVGVVLVLSSLVLWPLGNTNRPRFRTWFLWHTPALVTWAAFWIGASAQLEAHAALNLWVAHYWETHPMVLAPLFSLSLFLLLGLPPSEFSVGFATPGQISIFWTILSVTFGIVCLLVAAVRTLKPRFETAPTETRQFLFEIGFVALPLVALLVASYIVTPVYVLGRTDVLAYPAFVLLMGRGLANMPRRVSALFLGFWTVLSLLSLAPSYGIGNPKFAKGIDRRLAQAMIKNGLAPEDWVIHSYMTSPTIEYYTDRLDAKHQVGWFPLIAGENTASEYPTPADSADVYLEEAAELIRRMQTTLPEDGDVWIFGAIAPNSAVPEVLRTHTAKAEQIAYPTSLLVYSLVGNAAAPVSLIYHQDWVAGDRIVLRIPRQSWIPLEDQEPVKFHVQ